LARFFRVYEKKRGSRRTGSSQLGRAGELAFFAVFFLLGIGGLVAMFAFFVIPEWRVNHEFVEHSCRVLHKRLGEIEGADGAVYRPEVKIEYEIEGVTYVAWTYDIATALDAANSYSTGKQTKQAILERYLVDEENPREYPCWYDPLDPKVAVLQRGYSWWIWLAFMVPISFILIGGGGLIYAAVRWGKSAERCAAITRRRSERDPFGSNGRSEQEFPSIPDGAWITDSPGTRLQFRLPSSTSPGWALLGTLLACLFWNGIVAAFVVFAVHGHLEGWFLTLFIIPFVAAGMGLIVLFVRQILLTAGIGPTLVEISDHPLAPGGQYCLFFSQPGRLKFNLLDVALVCEEQATYRQGTNTRTENRRVYRQELFRQEGFEVQPAAPLEKQCEFTVPAGAMHSFQAEHNQIHWKVVVRGSAAGWPDYQRSFPVIIRPCSGTVRHE
jgi:hypothetical protein